MLYQMRGGAQTPLKRGGAPARRAAVVAGMHQFAPPERSRGEACFMPLLARFQSIDHAVMQATGSALPELD